MRFSYLGFTSCLMLFGFSLALPVSARGWVEQNSIGSATLDDVRMITSSTGYAVGDSGTILKTTNGATWSSVSKPEFSTFTFNAVEAIGDTVFVVGLNHLVKSTNGGTTWTEVTPVGLDLDGSADLYSVDFINSSIGFVVGVKTGSGIVLKTTDGGASWTTLTTLPPGTGTLWDIACVNASICYTVGNSGVILKTTTGGSSWLTQSAGTSSTLRGVTALSSTSAWAVGLTGTIRRTTDGSTWTNPGSPVTSTLFEVEFTSSSLGMVVGSSGVAYITENGGAEWQARTLPDGATTILFGLDMVGANIGWAVGFGGAIYRFDELGPTVGAVTPTAATAGATQTYSVSYSDLGGTGVEECRLYYSELDSVPTALSNPNGTSGIASGTHTFASAGTGTLQALCTDLAGNNSSGAQTTITIGSANLAPSTPTDLTQHDEAAGAPVEVGFTDNDESFTVRALVNDPDLDAVHLEIEWRPVGVPFTGAGSSSPAVSSGSATTISLLVSVGSYHWQLRTVDALGAASAWVPFGGNSEDAADFIVAVDTPSTDPPLPPPSVGSGDGSGGTGSSSGGSAVSFPVGFASGDLIKLANDGNPNTFGDSAVFYLGADGNRYVFTNDKSYFTWYSDFSPIRTISTLDMATIPLRGNVTYRPGVKMVKLQTSPIVYVVTARGALRAVPSEAVAIALYGSNWNREIDDINDAFWTNYTVGAPLILASDVNIVALRDAAVNFNVDRGLVIP